jgi:hypothetical protein
MSTKEKLITRKFKTHFVKGEVEPFFYVSAIKKAYPDASIHEADIKTFKINDKNVSCVLLRNVQF